MTKLTLAGLAASLMLIGATYSMPASAGFPSPNDPGAPKTTPTNPNLLGSCNKNNLGSEWLKLDPRFEKLYKDLVAILDAFEPGAADPIKSGNFTNVADAKKAFSDTKDQFDTFARNAAVATIDDCQKCQISADWQLIKDLTKSTPGELKHSNGKSSLSLASFDEAMVKAAATNFQNLRRLRAAQTADPFDANTILKLRAELDVMVGGWRNTYIPGLRVNQAAKDALLNKPAATTNTELDTLKTNYECIGFDS